jgi:hypothetical protein
MPDNTTHVVPAERLNFKALLLANPNHFGTIKNSKFPAAADIQGNTTYEAIGCVGYNPELHRLEATVQLKQSGGYLGDLCSLGSQEYVRFWVSFDNGTTWNDAGLSSFTAHDIARTQPITHAVGVPYDAGNVLCVAAKQAFKVRAILSWNNPPSATDPGFTPIWGNVVEIAARRSPINILKLPPGAHLPSLVAEAKLSPTALSAAVTAVADTSPAALAKLYADKGVPQHRFLYPPIAAALAKHPAGGAAIAGDLANLVPNANIAELVKLIQAQQGNVTFERLDCIGFEAADQMLAGVFTLRLANGYSGGPCTAGSLEHVAFFIDWHDGSGFHFVGATATRVHDQSDIPSDGIRYEVRVPLDAAPHQRPCNAGPVFAHVRAILSWNTPVPSSDPNFVPVWGNHQDAEIQIEPGQVVTGNAVVPILSAVGDISVAQIDTNGLIQNGTAIHTGVSFDDAPFGGRITLAGKIINGTGSTRYRIMRRLAGTGSFVPLTNEPTGITLSLVTYDPATGVHFLDLVSHADGEGYYTYQDTSSSHYVEGNILSIWFSNPAEDAHTYEVRVDVSIDGNPAHDVPSNVVHVKIDNQVPVAKLTVDNGADGECADYDWGTTVTGTFVATDTNIGSYAFRILPPNPANGAAAIPLATPFQPPPAPASPQLPQVYPSLADPGIAAGFYKIDTNPMKPCGYALVLDVWDRTNVNSGQTSNYNWASIGFCVRVPAPK